jgi:hypothetical protein
LVGKKLLSQIQDAKHCKQFKIIIMKTICNSLLFLFIISLISCSKDSNNVLTTTTTSTAGSLARFVIVGNYLYTIDNQTMSIFDISNAANPVLKNTKIVGTGIETIFPFQNKLFIGSNSAMFIYDITNPINPLKESESQHFTSCDPVTANAKNAYLTLHSNRRCRAGGINELQVYNIANGLINPVFKNRIQMTDPLGLGIKDNRLYVCNNAKGIAMFDITNGDMPVSKSVLSGETFMDVIPISDFLVCMLSDGICYLDISNPDVMKKLGTVKN